MRPANDSLFADDFNDDHRTILEAALDVINEYGRPAAQFVRDQLAHEANAEACAWIEDLFELQPTKEGAH